MKEKVMNSMQSFAKAMIGLVLYLPIVGMSIALCAVATNTAIVSEGGFIWTIGRFFNGVMNPIMGNLSILFCVGIAIGMDKKKKAEAAFVSIMSYITFLGGNSRWLELSGKMAEGATAGDLYGTGQTIQLGFHVTDMGVFLGMIIGVLVAIIHNKYCDKEFKGVLAPYGNSKLVFIVMLPIVAVLSISVTYIWPTIANGITSLTGFMSGAGALGVFIYGFLNRFLIPTGLHHLIWSPFLFSAVGDQMIVNGENVIGAKPVFLALLNDTSVAMMLDSARFLTYGLVKTFGIIGVSLAFYYTAKKRNKNRLKSQLVPSTLTSVIAGITEPLEFTFIFAAPILWFVYSIIDGLFQMFVYMANVRVCATNGILDFLVLNLPAGIERSNWPIYVLIGLIEIGVIFIVFKFMIEKFDLKTPGREDDDVEKLNINDKLNKNEVLSQKEQSKNVDANEARGMKIIEGLGGRDNILSVDNCFSRLRVEVKDSLLINETTLKSTGAAGVIKKGNNIQVVYGLSINEVRTIVDDSLERLEKVANN